MLDVWTDLHRARCVWKDEVPEPVRVCAPGTPAGNLTVRVTEIWHTEKVRQSDPVRQFLAVVS